MLLATQPNGIYNFAAYNLFVPAAARLLQGARLGELGEVHQGLKQRPWPGYVQQGQFVRIYVQFIDDYGNAYLGMSYEEFERLRPGRHFVMKVRELEVRTMSGAYATGKALPSMQLTVSATGQLELAMGCRSLAQLAGLKANESVLLEFRD